MLKACRRVPTALFFTDPPSGAAVVLCSRCDVREEYLAYVMSDPNLAGYWAGTTGRERARMRRERKAA